MQITNIYFSKIIKLENRLREFNFRKLPNTNNNFHVRNAFSISIVAALLLFYLIVRYLKKSGKFVE